MSSKTQKNDAGFTLVEMLVVISIFIVITTVILARGSQFDNTVILGTLAYDVALSVREAQSFGLGVREVSIGSSEDFTTPHGIEVWSSQFGDDGTTYYLSADLNENNVLTENERIKSFTLNQGFEIVQVCGSITQQACDADTGKLNILFRRPDPDAIMVRGNGDIWVYTEIHIQSPDGSQRVVAITDAGQIAVVDAGL